jgi:cellulose synthase/poly-beta-1,6-N-acetylglucosamine synthase-like glycosyltransferase
LHIAGQCIVLWLLKFVPPIDEAYSVFLVSALAAITIVAALSQLVAYLRMYGYVNRELRREPDHFCPKVAVILPCKGLDPGFKENIKKLFEQKYSKPEEDERANFEIVFAVASHEDPAYEALSEAMKNYPNVPSRLIVAPQNSQRAQKVNNQLHALKQISSEAEILVFVDSDVIAGSDFISYLVRPLKDKNVGIATGYRFYIPFRGDWPSLLRALWNRLTAWELASKNFTFAWGGAMAITRANFQRARIEEVWDKACDDDLSMTTAVKKLGLKVQFVPQCLVASDGDASLAEILEWMNRQLVLTKVYYPALWRKAIARAGILAFWLLAVLIAAYQGIVKHESAFQFAFYLGLSLLLLEFLFLAQAQGMWRRVLFRQPDDKERAENIDRAYDRSFWRSIWVLPLAHCLLPWMTLNSLFTNRIQWRGVIYELKSPEETIVVRS